MGKAARQRVIPYFLAVVTVIGCPGRVNGQNTKPLRFDITPLIGYRSGMSFPTGENAQSTAPHVGLDANPSYGAAFGVRLNEEDLVEFRWARQDSHVHLEDGALSPKEAVVLDQFHGDFTHEYITDFWPASVRPFVVGSVGATHIGGAMNSVTRFSFGLGGGIKVYFTRHIGMRMQGEWLPLVVNPDVARFICGGGCIVHLSASLVSQGEVLVGPVFRF